MVAATITNLVLDSRMPKNDLRIAALSARGIKLIVGRFHIGGEPSGAIPFDLTKFGMKKILACWISDISGLQSQITAFWGVGTGGQGSQIQILGPIPPGGSTMMSATLPIAASKYIDNETDQHAMGSVAAVITTEPQVFARRVLGNVCKLIANIPVDVIVNAAFGITPILKVRVWADATAGALGDMAVNISDDPYSFNCDNDGIDLYIPDEAGYMFKLIGTPDSLTAVMIRSSDAKFIHDIGDTEETGRMMSMEYLFQYGNSIGGSAQGLLNMANWRFGSVYSGQNLNHDFQFIAFGQ